MTLYEQEQWQPCFEYRMYHPLYRVTISINRDDLDQKLELRKCVEIDY
jgi:hypothetical protein